MTGRGEYIAGLRQLADLLEQHDELDLPYGGSAAPLSVIPVSQRQRGQLAAWARAIPGSVEKKVRGDFFDLEGSLHGLRIIVITDRDAVCERVVTGTETVETVEWVCRPLLSDESPDAES